MVDQKVLVVDDEIKIREQFSEVLRSEGFNVETAENGAIAIERIDEGFFDVALIDLNMPKVDGMSVLKHLVENAPDSVGIILTGYASIRNAVISKPNCGLGAKARSRLPINPI